MGGSECGHRCAAWHLLHLGWLDLLMAALIPSSLPPTSLQKLAGQVRSPTFGLVPGCACPWLLLQWVLGETLYLSPGDQHTGGIWE